MHTMTGSLLSPRRNPLPALAVAAAGCWILNFTAHADWLSYRGPSQTGVSLEKGLKLQFPADGPKVLWKANVGTGTSSVTVSGDRAYTMGNSGGKDRAVCFDVKTGRELWKNEYPLEVDKRMFEGGTAATPTIDGTRVYTVSHQGDLFCLDAATGQKVWYKHYQKDLGGRRPQWGFAGSPTIEENLLILDVGARGGSTVALNKANGNVVWKSGDDEAGYASPVAATIGGKRTVVMFKASDLVGLDVKDGSELWRTKWKTNYDVNAATPLVVGERIFISSGYGAGCALIEISGGRAVEKWRNRNLKAHINSPVFSKGLVYGIDDQANANAPLVCLDFATGQTKWSQRGIGGALIAADGKLIILSELGELIIADESPNGFRATARAQVLPKRCWVQPTLANGRLFCRNNDGQLVCLDLGAK
ncbi:MAG: outer membrane protein assembly factor BamB [Chthoniobacter sp.]|jgi:outer membrane protein assembly factor BamB|nr:outer membrane protein assembly factor BamB [Chthoniobacter sp.]